MEVLWHDYISVNHEAVFLARFFEDLQEEIAAFRRAQLRLAVVATAGDEVLIVVAVKAMQALGHPVRVDIGVLAWL